MTSIINAVIVDDEPFGAEALAQLVAQECPGIRITGKAGSVESGRTLITKQQPGLVFLDIEMADGTGFDLLQAFPNAPFRVIFVTGYDKYALQAIKCCAVDYLLKPVEAADLVNAVNKLETGGSTAAARLEHLLQFISKPQSKSSKICIPTQSGMELMQPGEILYAEASREYTMLHTIKNGVIVSSYNIGEFETMLEGFGFFRIHNSFIVNREHLVRYVKGEGGTAVMSNKMELPVSRRRKNEFLEWLKG